METSPSPEPVTRSAPVHDALDVVQRQLTVSLLLGVVTSIAMLAFMMRVTLLQRRGITGQQPAVERVLREEYPRLRAILGEFERFGASHPDFAEKVLRRYNLKAAAALPGGPALTNGPAAP